MTPFVTLLIFIETHVHRNIYTVNIERLEKAQKKFLKSLDHRTDQFSFDYETVAKKYNEHSLLNRRVFSGGFSYIK